MRQFLQCLQPTHLTNYSLWKVCKKANTKKIRFMGENPNSPNGPTDEKIHQK